MEKTERIQPRFKDDYIDYIAPSDGDPVVETPVKVTIFDRLRFALTHEKRNTGMILVGTSEMMTSQGVGLAVAPWLGAAGWVLLILGVGHAIVKNNKAKKEELGSTEIDKLIELLKELWAMIKNVWRK